jgi:dUTP pyrophosphatase
MIKKILFIKTHPSAKMPTKKYPSDAAYDLYAVESVYVYANVPVVIPIGLKIQLPENCFAEIHTRSSQGMNNVRNHLGIIDTNFRGEIGPILISANDLDIHAGDKVAQLIIKEKVPVEWVEVAKLEESDRGENGFGSSGR